MNLVCLFILLHSGRLVNDADIAKIIIFRFKKITVNAQCFSQIASFVPKDGHFDWSRGSKLCNLQQKGIGHV